MTLRSRSFRSVRCRWLLVLVLALLVAFRSFGPFVGSPVAHAATTIAVTTTDDELNNDGDCSLREAIQAANTDTAVDACAAGSGTDTITLPAGTYTLTIAGINEDSNATGDLDITSSVSINGSGATTTIINANALDRALHSMGTAALTLQDLTVENGIGSGIGGAGIHADASLTLNRTIMKANTVGSEYGGAVFASGPVIVTDSEFLGNHSGNRAAGLYATAGATLTNTNFRDSTGTAEGGAAFLWGTVTITGGVFSNNHAGATGGLVVVSGPLTMTGTQFIGNTAASGAGALFLQGSGQIVNTLFARNSGASSTGQVIVTGNTDIIHSTIANPTLANQSGIYILGGTINIQNTIITSHTRGIDNAGGTVTEDYNLLFNNTTPINGIVTSGGHNQSSDPRFWAVGCDIYKIGPGSGAMDTGTNASIASDFEGDSRPLVGGFDIGFDEATSASFEIPIYCLKATNTSPKTLGTSTALAASIAGGTNVTYAWSFGDGSTDSSATTSHTYPAIGTYTAIVTATNSVGSVSATTLVTIVDVPIGSVSATSDSPTVLSQTTHFTATVNTGTNVIYTWNFGDGQTGSGATTSHTYATAGPFTATVTASNGAGSKSTTTSVTVQPVRITGAAPPVGTYGIAYSYSFTANGPTPITWSIISGSLPPGVTLDGATGTLSGTPTQVGSFNFTIRASNSAGNTTMPTSVTITDVPIGSVSATNDSPTVLGQTTHFTATVSTGTNVLYTWNFGDSQTGSGATTSHTYATAGPFTATVTVSNAAGSANATTSVTIQPVRITGATPPSALYGAAYSYSFIAIGPPPITWSIVAGSLPPGVTLDGTTGTLSGTPTQAGSFSFTIQASNTAGTDSQVVLITIGKAALTVTAADTIRRVGQPNPNFTVLYTGFANADTATSVLSGSPACSTSATIGSPVGTYPITCAIGTLTAANYDFTFVDGTLTVTDKEIPTINWNTSIVITYGMALNIDQIDPTASTGGSPLAGTFSYTPTIGTILHAGNGQIVEVTFTPDDLATYTPVTKQVQIDVLKATLTIRADNKVKNVNDPLPALSASYSGFVNSDAASVLDTPVALNTTATSASPVGHYLITISGATDTDYQITFVNGDLTVLMHLYIPTIRI